MSYSFQELLKISENNSFRGSLAYDPSEFELSSSKLFHRENSTKCPLFHQNNLRCLVILPRVKMQNKWHQPPSTYHILHHEKYKDVKHPYNIVDPRISFIKMIYNIQSPHPWFFFVHPLHIKFNLCLPMSYKHRIYLPKLI